MSRQVRSFARAALAVLLLVCAVSAAAQKPRYARVRPQPDGDEAEFAAAALPASSQNTPLVSGHGIDYHGGPVMTPTNGDGTVNIYFIWYGNWVNGPRPSDSPNTRDLLSALFSSTGLNNSGYEKINQTYGDAGSNVTGSVALVKQIGDNYSRGTRLKDADVEHVVASAINSAALPNDPHGIYFVLSSSDVAETSGFCVKYCGWHNSALIAGSDIKFGFVGNPDRCPSLCEAQTTSPNSNSGADAMATILVHESQESITDPDGNAWYDALGNENSDKCAWKFGPTQTTSDGARYNHTFANYRWLLQMNWSNSLDPATGQRGGCAQTAGGPFYNE